MQILRGRLRDIRDRKSDAVRPRQFGVPWRSRRNATIQAARLLEEKPSITLIRPPSIIVTTLGVELSERVFGNHKRHLKRACRSTGPI